MKMQTQTEMFNRSKQLVPGGVHSPVRSFKGMDETPVFFKQANGAFITDTDDKEYIDFCMSFGPLILGHKNKKVQKDLENALDKGWSYGACEPYSLDLASLITENISFIDQIRFVNSGTEAVMTALRLARGVTGKNKIIKFNGCYHGHVDSMLIKAGSGLAGTAEASSKGISESVASETLIFELGDTQGIKEAFTNHNDIAAIIIEPLPANNGLLIQDEGYLQFLREITKENGALLIFDEVISGFRMGMEGMSGVLGIDPDIVTYGKVIGGGLPVGALAGKKAIMEHLAPIGDVYQAGTLSANPLAMVGGFSTLSQMTKDAYLKLEKNALKIVETFSYWLENYNQGQFSHIKIINKGSLFWFTPKADIKRAIDIPADLSESFKPMFSLLLEKGIYLAPNAYEVGFVSLAHDETVCAELKNRLWSK
ncbi:MAG: glutamate-1-semialdehyde 2,1-aminomutase [Bacteriovoracaceae bacterium]